MDIIAKDRVINNRDSKEANKAKLIREMMMLFYYLVLFVDLNILF